MREKLFFCFLIAVKKAIEPRLDLLSNWGSTAQPGICIQQYVAFTYRLATTVDLRLNAFQPQTFRKMKRMDGILNRTAICMSIAGQ